ncbi:MAG: amidohydrolase family protein [Candidatus Woesearchaeota archaeon]
MKKIDIHAHITNRKLERIVQKSAWIDTLKDEMKEYKVEKTVVLASYFPHKGTGISNYRLYNWIRNEKDLIMFGSLDFEHYYNQGYNELEELAENNRISGIKIYTTYQNIDFKSDKMNKIVDLASKYNLPLMFHSGPPHAESKYDSKFSKLFDPLDIEYLANKTNVNFIVSHMDKLHLDSLIDVMKKCKNVYTDISGLYDSKYESEEFEPSVNMIKKFLKAIGPEQLLFGTDFPVQTHKDSVNMIEKAMKNYSLEDKEKVYYYNSKKLLGAHYEQQ